MYEQPPSDPLGRLPRTSRTTHAALRASDADREAVAAQLRRHQGEGRLAIDELEARSARCYAATTIGELQELLADLPRATTPPSAPKRADARGDRLFWVAAALAAALALGVLLAVGATGLLWLASIPGWIALKRHKHLGGGRRRCSHAAGHPWRYGPMPTGSLGHGRR